MTGVLHHARILYLCELPDLLEDAILLTEIEIEMYKLSITFNKRFLIRIMFARTAWQCLRIPYNRVI